jgi:hypothetical protein
MPSYDRSLFDPPAPLARVTLRHRQTGQVVPDVPMLIHSGADITLLPQDAVAQLGVDLTAGEEYELMGFDGATSISRSVQVDLLFLRRTFHGRFLLTAQEWGILGRDVLNHLSLVLDGPALHWGEGKLTDR